MPASLVSDLLIIHSEIEMMKAEELDKVSSDAKSKLNNIR